MDEDRNPPFWKDDIWRTGKISAVQPEPIAGGEQGTPHNNLWLGVFAANAGHHPAPDCGLYDIDHGFIVKQAGYAAFRVDRRASPSLPA
jgi:hypothetical protein